MSQLASPSSLSHAEREGSKTSSVSGYSIESSSWDILHFEVFLETETQHGFFTTRKNIQGDKTRWRAHRFRGTRINKQTQRTLFLKTPRVETTLPSATRRREDNIRMNVRTVYFVLCDPTSSEFALRSDSVPFVNIVTKLRVPWICENTDQMYTYDAVGSNPLCSWTNRPSSDCWITLNYLEYAGGYHFVWRNLKVSQRQYLELWSPWLGRCNFIGDYHCFGGTHYFHLQNITQKTTIIFAFPLTIGPGTDQSL